MLSRLSPAHYLDAAIFDQERQHIFRKLWLFATFRTALAEQDAFVVRELGGIQVLLQNCDGEVRAFENLCAHRQMPLQQQAFGQARMICPYHGWVYNGHGAVKAIPHEAALYDFAPEERERLRLRRFAVREVGNLVFVNLDSDPTPFDEQFSRELQTELHAISAHFGAQAIHADLPAHYNWKINYENVLDYNHVPYIHTKSFLPLLRAGETVASQPSVSPIPLADDDPPSQEAATLAGQSFSKRSPIHIDPWPWHANVDRYGDGSYYYNFFLYPNVNFISLGGLVFLLQQFHPIAPGRTEVRFTLCAARETRRLPALPAILWGHLKSEIAVLHEDQRHLEALQAGLHAGASRAHHGRYEHRLQAAAEIYLRLLDGTRR